MTLTSMTGFARMEGDAEGLRCVWEIRSVNGKGLDVRMRLPTGFEGLEVAARSTVQRMLSRGNVSATLSVQRDVSEAQPRVNHDVLDQFAETASSLAERYPTLRAASIDGLMSLRGVVEAGEDEPDEEREAQRHKTILKILDDAVSTLGKARMAEGARIADVIVGMVEQIATLSDAAAEIVADQRDILRERRAEAVRDLLSDGSGLDPERLEQEVAILYAKADVREELDRLQTHLTQARELLSADDAVGRRFDFLCQEFNREANTLCSKAAIGDLSRVGLDLKIVIDQLREQVQNIE